MTAATFDLDPVVANLISSARKHGTPLVVIDDSLLRFTALARLITGLAYDPLHGSWAADGSVTLAEPPLGPVTWTNRHAASDFGSGYPAPQKLAAAHRRMALQLAQQKLTPELPLALGYDKHSALHALQLARGFDVNVDIWTMPHLDTEIPAVPPAIMPILDRYQVRIREVEKPLLTVLDRVPRDVKAVVKKVANYELTRAEFLRALEYNTPTFAARLRELVPVRAA